MGKLDFNRDQCIKALMKIGFRNGNNRRGNHDKFLMPEYLERNRNPSQPPFIVVPRSRQSHCQFAIIKELKNLGGEELADKFLKNI